MTSNMLLRLIRQISACDRQVFGNIVYLVGVSVEKIKSASLKVLLKSIKSSALLTGAGIYVFSSILMAAIPFALLPILTRYLSPQEYGEVAMFQSTLAVLTSIAGLSVHGAAGRKYFDTEIDADGLQFFIGACLQILFATTGVSFIIVIAFREQLQRLVGLGDSFLFLCVIGSAANFVIQMRMTQWQVRKKPVDYGVMQVSQAVLNVCLSLFLVLGLSLGAAGRIWAQVCTLVIFAAFSVTSLYREKLIGLAWRPDYIREALQFGFPLVPHTLGLLLLNLFDRFLIDNELGLAEAGIYMVALQVVSPMGLVFTSFNNAYAPWLFEHLRDGHISKKIKIVRLTYLYFLIVISTSLCAFLIGPFVISMFAGDRYESAGRLIGWLALSQSLGGMYLMVTNYIFFSKKTAMLSLVTVTSGVVNVFVLVLAVHLFGVVGAAVASTFSMFVRFVLTWSVAQARHPMPWFNASLLFYHS